MNPLNLNLGFTPIDLDQVLLVMPTSRVVLLSPHRISSDVPSHGAQQEMQATAHPTTQGAHNSAPSPPQRR